ncbi:GNAT family N-acetyltransferase [Amnibacterium sp. CER49]|uniref:GNAT family N-acetyltransferase n=1 Tax=Amnibacterium sp. CER49 TaxID=3039161 RepID=UPI002449CE6F|nr:GNAT family N-acetyltransferase [Amnibacterium sp. CER49]MDH2442475.1 GNAT family N-acetyltransferase [Amnibacterium sp. CER49]
MITLPERPRLRPPSEAVRVSYLVGEQADCVHERKDPSWLGSASEDFPAHVRRIGGVQERWGVPSEVLWFTAGEHYLGTLVLRHRLTPELERVGGHIGYHVVLPWRRQGHATAMLRQALPLARAAGLERVLVTCATRNAPSARVIEANGGQEDEPSGEERRFWIVVPPDRDGPGR